MKSILLIYPIRDDGFPSWVPLGLCSIGTVLDTRGCKVKVIDMRWHSQEELRKSVKNVDLVGIGPVSTMRMPYALEIAQFCKSINESVKVIFGGSHPTIFPQQCLSFSQVDYAVIGEGEFTILDLVEGKKETEISGLAYKCNNRIFVNESRKFIENLDTLPIPDRELFPIQEMLKAVPSSPCLTPYPFVNMHSSRGCPYNCLFCQPTLRKVFGTSVRRRSHERVVDEFEYLIEKYKPAAICMTDDLFVTDEKWVSEVCKEIRRRKLHDKVVWECESRANTFNEKIALELKKSGCFRVWFGTESFCQKTLNTLRKGTTVKQNKVAVRLCHKVGLIPLVQIMIGSPYETHDDLMETINCLKETDPEIVWVTSVSPIPGTDLYDLCKRNDLLIAKSLEDFDRSFTGKPKIKLPEKFDLYADTIAKLDRSFFDIKFLPRSYYRKAYIQRLKCHTKKGNFREILYDSAPNFLRMLRPLVGRSFTTRLYNYGRIIKKGKG